MNARGGELAPDTLGQVQNYYSTLASSSSQTADVAIPSVGVTTRSVFRHVRCCVIPPTANALIRYLFGSWSPFPFICIQIMIDTIQQIIRRNFFMNQELRVAIQ